MSVNKSIGCNVCECKHHAQRENYCTLKNISVIKNSDMAHEVKHTDCGSFDTK